MAGKANGEQIAIRNQARVHAWKTQGLRGSELVKTVIEDWEDTVKKVASEEVGEEVIVCGKAARWWDDKLKERIRLRRKFYKEISCGREGKWGANCDQKSRNWYIRRNEIAGMW